MIAATDVVTVAPMRRRHLRSVLRIEALVHPRPWSLNLFLSELRYGPSRIYLVARTGPTVVGYAGAMLVAGDAHVTNVAVDPPLQGGGIATRLLVLLCRRSIEEGATALTLEVRTSNNRAQELYRRFGFAPAGMRKNYYSDTNEDALIMWATDVATPEYAERLVCIEQSFPTPTTWDAR